MARLTLDSMPPIEGDVEVGGDYVRFTTATAPDKNAFGEPRDGTVEFDGHSEKVMLESAQQEGDAGFVLVLRRYQPSA